MKNLSVKWQMGLVAALAALGMMLSVVLQQYSLSHLESLQNERVQINQIESGMLTLRRNEKDFLARKDPKYIDNFRNNYEAVENRVKLLTKALENQGLDHTIADKLAAILSGYQKRFLDLVEQQNQIGLDHKTGLYGALRKAVHQAEGLMKAQQQDKLSKDMLMLRRREKDFMLRMDLTYINKFDQDMAVLQQDLSAAPIGAGIKQEIISAMNAYEKDFKALVNANIKLGLSSKEGLLGDMRKTIHQSEALLAQLQTETGQHVEAEISRLNAQALTLNVILAVAILGLIAFVVPGVTKPVRQLAALMSHTSKEWDVTVRADDTGSHEIAVMARAFNRMMAGFQEIISQISGSSSQLSSAAEQLGIITRGTNEGASRQQSETEQVATAMNEMTVTVQEVARHASSAADASEAADVETQKGRGIVEQTMDGIHALENEVMNAATVISDLSKESENIGTVLSVIREIAGQTNLLALNAAIEAARAGEQGRGFAVVADEVRTLAQRSHESTEEIQVIVERLQQAAERAVSAMEKGKVQAQESAACSQVATDSLKAILNVVSSIKEMNMQIATAAEEQAAVSEEVNRNIVNINDVTRETSANTQQTMETGQSLSELANQLRTLVSRFKVA